MFSDTPGKLTKLSKLVKSKWKCLFILWLVVQWDHQYSDSDDEQLMVDEEITRWDKAEASAPDEIPPLI